MMTMEGSNLHRRGFGVIALGDFNARVGKIPGLEDNTPGLNDNTPLFRSFIQSLNLLILNSLPISQGLWTHFFEREGSPPSESILDYGLADSETVNFVSSFIVDSDARVQCGSDHSLLEVTADFTETVQIRAEYSDILKYKLPVDNDYTKFNKCVEDKLASIPLSDFSNCHEDDQASFLSKVLLEACCENFIPPPPPPRKCRKNWLPPSIIKHLRAKRLLNRKISGFRRQLPNHPDSFPVILRLEKILRNLRVRVRNMLCQHKVKQAATLRNRLLRNDPNLRKFWRFVREHGAATQQISASYTEEGDVVFEPEKVEDEVLRVWGEVFNGQEEPVAIDGEERAPLPTLPPDHLLTKYLLFQPPDKHEKYVCRPFTRYSLKCALENLKCGKSMGTDNLPAEVLKFAGRILGSICWYSTIRFSAQDMCLKC